MRRPDPLVQHPVCVFDGFCVFCFFGGCYKSELARRRSCLQAPRKLLSLPLAGVGHSPRLSGTALGGFWRAFWLLLALVLPDVK